MDTTESFYRKAYWKKRFIWKRPRRCDITGKLLWFRYAYEGVAMWTGPGNPVFEFRYHDVNEHLIWKISN